MISLTKNTKQKSLLFNLVILISMLCLTGIASTGWVQDESGLNNLDKAKKQAAYFAEYGIRQQVFNYLQSRPPHEIKKEINLSSGNVYDNLDKERIIGQYSKIKLVKNDNFEINKCYDVYCTGTVFGNNLAANDNKNTDPDAISRTVRMQIRYRDVSEYLFLTYYDQQYFTDYTYFTGRDQLHGVVHSNAHIGIQGNPSFYGPVSTSEDEFREINANPYFEFPPVFDALQVQYYSPSFLLRTNAGCSGNYISNCDGQYWTRLWCDNGIWQYLQWPAGTPFDSLTSPLAGCGSIYVGGNTAVFFEGDVFIWGEGSSGNLTIGSSGNMWLCDDITVAGYAPDSRLPISQDNPNYITLVSEKNIIVKDSYPNGRGGSQGNGLNSDTTNITITAAMLAPVGVFTFEHKNNPGDNYNFCISNDRPDERGDIILRGSLMQYYHGATHNDNCGGTGYGLDYMYDERFRTSPPPFVPLLTDEQGNGLVKIISTEEVSDINMK